MSRNRKLRVLTGMGRAVIRTAEPSYLILYVNNTCNLRCSMCLAWDRMQRRTGDMTLEEFARLSRSFDNLVQLTVTGGEPVLNRDLPAIIEAFYRHSHLAKCTLVTNGTYTQRTTTYVQDVLRRCPHLDLRVTVSLDGTRDVHERIRSVPGCFDKSCQTLDRLIELRDRCNNLSVTVTSVISKDNWRWVEDLYRLVQTRFDVDGHGFLLARGKTKEPGAGDVPLTAYRRIAELLERRENRSTQYLSGPLTAMSKAVRSVVARVAQSDENVLPCVAGRKLVEVYSNGDVVPCEMIEQKHRAHIGNVRDFDYDIVKLLQADQAQKIRRFIRDTKCRCTFECAIFASLAFNPMQYPKILRGMGRGPEVINAPSPERNFAERHSPGVQPA